MDNWEDIHPDFTKKLQKRWENFGFVYEQVEEWIKFYGFSPFDVDFAVFIGDNDFIISEMTKEELAKLREKYNEAVKNKEIEFPFEEESEEEEIITSRERNWRDIHRDFIPELVQRWQECGFIYEETSDWINIGMGIADAEFCAWLRDVKRVDAEWILNNGNIEQLQIEYQHYCLLKMLNRANQETGEEIVLRKKKKEEINTSQEKTFTCQTCQQNYSGEPHQVHITNFQDQGIIPQQLTFICSFCLKDKVIIADFYCPRTSEGRDTYNPHQPQFDCYCPTNP